MGLSPTPNIPVNTPGGCSSWDGPYAGTHLSNCQESTLWNVSDCKGHDPCDSWVDGGNCCEFCAQIGWPTNAPTNTACGGVGTGGNPNGSNNWFCECCDPESLPSKLEPTLDLEPINKMEFDPRDTERFQKLANIKRRI